MSRFGSPVLGHDARMLKLQRRAAASASTRFAVDD